MFDDHHFRHVTRCELCIDRRRPIAQVNVRVQQRRKPLRPERDREHADWHLGELILAFAIGRRRAHCLDKRPSGDLDGHAWPWLAVVVANGTLQFTDLRQHEHREEEQHNA
jgi:hypothetical protein